MDTFGDLIRLFLANQRRDQRQPELYGCAGAAGCHHLTVDDDGFILNDFRQLR